MRQNLTEIVNNPKYKLVLVYEYMEGASKRRDSITGWINDEFATQVGAQYESLFGSGFIGGKTLAQIEYLTGNWELAERLFGSQGAMRVKSVHQTVNWWTGSSSPEWAVSFVVPRLSIKEKPVTHRVRTLQKAVMAGRDGVKVTFPWRPTKEMADNPDAIPPGTASLHLGEWLSLYGLLITNVSVTFSKEVTKDGTPLYALVNVGFMPWRYQFTDDVDRWYSSGGVE